MADGCDNPSSASDANTTNKTGIFETKIEKSSFLFYNANNFSWKGDLKSLKAFVAAILKCDNGKWSSPRGEEKLFKSKEFSLKWHGPKKEKLQIMKDNQEKSLQSALEASAQTNGVEIPDENIKTATHVVDTDKQQQAPKQNVDENNRVCGNCEEYKLQIANIMTLVVAIKAKEDEESQRSVSISKRLERTIKTLSEQNSKMAAEIDQLNSNMKELTGENASIKCILDIKQHEWTKVSEKPKNSSKPTVNTDKIPLTPNAFEMLDVEEPSPCHYSKEAAQTKKPSKENPTRCRKPPKFVGTNKLKGGPNTTGITTKKSTAKHNQETAVLVIGDSMVKGIDANKIGRAARTKAISHSYSGATVNQLVRKFDENQAEEPQYGTIILHVGTNDLVRKEPEEVAADMECLIEKAKGHTKKVGVSGAIKRYDGKVNNLKIEQYNEKLHDICSKHKITYIDNSHIGKSLLNGSNLHLNREGDKALGGAFCNYLKADRFNRRNTHNHFFRPPPGHQKEWTMYISHVRRMMKCKLD